MTDTPRLWDRRADETPKSYAAFRAYVARGVTIVARPDRQPGIDARLTTSCHDRAYTAVCRGFTPAAIWDRVARGWVGYFRLATSPGSETHHSVPAGGRPWPDGIG